MLDLIELEKCSHIKEEDFNIEINKLLNKINNTLLENKSYLSGNIIYERFKNKYTIKINCNEFKFEFFFRQKDNKLILVYFDKIIDSEKVAQKKDLAIILFEFIFLIVFCKCEEIIPFLKIFVYTLMVGNFILYIVVKNKVKNEKTIWFNKETFDSYRKWFRCRNISDLSRLYYCVCWINIWMFSLLLLTISNVGNISLILSSALYFYAIKYLFKMYRLGIIYGAGIILVLIFMGYLNKDIWSFITLLFVILNQIFSSDIIYLANKYNKKQRKKIEKYISTQEGKAKTIKLKFQINIIIALFYVFIMFFESSRIINPIIFYFLKENLHYYIPTLLIVAVERIGIFILILNLLKTNIKIIVNLRRSIIERGQIIINYISEKLYNI